jgi:lysine-specific demethylase PHF8
MVVRLDGDQLTLEYLEKNGFDRPILVADKTTLNFNIPDQSQIDLTKIQDIVGSDIMLDVIDVERQLTVPMTINELNEYFKAEHRDKIYNLISFEISKTNLSENITPPCIVNDISWISNGIWPSDEDANTSLNNSIANLTPTTPTMPSYIVKPEVQKYCLISAANSYTDFHIDFGGSSVWYHIVKGDKTFYLIEPNSENMDAYEKWNSLKNHSEIFLGDRVKNCYRFDIKAGNTIFLPTGWIHAVYTPDDSLVFGGNFLTNYNIPLQLK